MNNQESELIISYDELDQTKKQFLADLADEKVSCPLHKLNPKFVSQDANYQFSVSYCKNSFNMAEHSYCNYPRMLHLIQSNQSFDFYQYFDQLQHQLQYPNNLSLITRGNSFGPTKQPKQLSPALQQQIDKQQLYTFPKLSAELLAVGMFQTEMMRQQKLKAEQLVLKCSAPGCYQRFQVSSQVLKMDFGGDLDLAFLIHCKRHCGEVSYFRCSKCVLEVQENVKRSFSSSLSSEQNNVGQTQVQPQQDKKQSVNQNEQQQLSKEQKQQEQKQLQLSEKLVSSLQMEMSCYFGSLVEFVMHCQWHSNGTLRCPICREQFREQNAASVHCATQHKLEMNDPTKFRNC